MSQGTGPSVKNDNVGDHDLVGSGDEQGVSGGPGLLRRSHRARRKGDMGTEPQGETQPAGSGNRRLMLVLAAGVFVLVGDTSLMNGAVSAVAAVVETPRHGVQLAA